MTAIETIAQLRPIENNPVRTLLMDAGIDVSHWATTKSGEPLENPNTNSYRNSFWSFRDENGNVALCIWFKNIRRSGTNIEYQGNLQAEAVQLEQKALSIGLSSGEKGSLSNRATKAREFHRMVGQSYRLKKSVRVIVLGDNVGAEGQASHPDRRLLDPEPWHVASFDGLSGELVVRRGPSPIVAPRDEEMDEDVEVNADVLNIDAITGLSETEKRALIKLRVGQGLFRKRLINRWQVCALTGGTRLLFASHIIPWSQCTTPAQRLGVHNGLLLTAHIDSLFDSGLITFDDRFQIVISPLLSFADRRVFNLMPNVGLRARHEDLLPALEWHRKNVYKTELPINANM